MKKIFAGKNLPVCFARVLLLLVSITFYLVGALYAKYGSGDHSGMQARVAGYGQLTLTETGDFAADNEAIILPGVDLVKDATVHFDGGEVASYVFVEVTLSSHWSSDDNATFEILSGSKTLLQWSMVSDWSYLTKTASGTYVFWQLLAPNQSLTEDVIASDGLITVSQAATKSELAAMTGVFINLRATAVQSGGFDSPASAWNSISG